jgi:hypothetical protein
VPALLHFINPPVEEDLMTLASSLRLKFGFFALIVSAPALVNAAPQKNSNIGSVVKQYAKACVTVARASMAEKPAEPLANACDVLAPDLAVPAQVESTLLFKHDERLVVEVQLKSGKKVVHDESSFYTLPKVSAPSLARAMVCYDVGGNSQYCTNGKGGCYWYGDSLKWCRF